MEVKRVVLETLEMMGFTFLVGMGVAYVIKFLVEVFHFFRKGNVSEVVRDYKDRIVEERKRYANMKKILTVMEKESDVEFLKYLYENKNKSDAEEEVNDIYNLFKFYRGIYKDKKDDSGDINALIKYYNGEV